MASATSYNVTTNREDISDDLTILAPEETPIMSMIAKGKKPGAVYTEWPIDALKPISTDVTPEGEETSSFDNPAEYRDRIGNMIGIQKTTWSVTDLQEEMDQAGVADEVATAKIKKLAEMKRNIEARIGGDFEMVATGPNYAQRGLGNWISSSAQSVNPVPSTYLTPSASIDTTATGSLTESVVQGVLTSIYRQTGSKKAHKAFCGVNWKSAVSNFSRITGTNHRTFQVTQPADSKKITLDVQTYEGDFGSIDLIPDLHLGYGASTTQNIKDARCYVLDPSLLAMSWLWAPYHEELPNNGGGRRGHYKAAWTLVVKNPLGLGKFAATS